MPLTPNSWLGPYQIIAPLGSGGMGEVYRAHDSRLGRDVAIKILPAAFINDPERLSRFEREARMLASINHPNIASIYGVEDIGGVRALVLELVEGEDLTLRLHPATKFRVDEVVSIAGQIADALDAAHERGIVHRDLKPGNIRVTPDGVIKVLDFGIAKPAADGSSANLTNSPTTLGPTVEGTLLGTAPYMSPEQARGKAVDKRTDIWAFGCVVYEMLTCKRAFSGDTTSDTIAAILQREPDWQALPLNTTPGLKQLLHRCLEKDLKKRLRDIGDARIDLAGKGPAVETSNARASTIPWIVALVATAAAVILGIRSSQSKPKPFVAPVVERLTFDPGITASPSLSPDGSLLAYASTRSGRGDLDIWIQQMAGGAPLRLTDDPADDGQPDLSPDGSRVLFRSERNGGGAYVVQALGGPARLIANGARDPRFSPDGSSVAYWTGQFRGAVTSTNSEVHVQQLSGGNPRRLLEHFAVARNPVWAPDGKSLLVLAMGARPATADEPLDWWRVSIDGGTPTRTTLLDLHDWRQTAQMERMTAGPWSREGLLLALDGALWQIRPSLATGVPDADPKPVVSGGARIANPTGSRDGLIVYAGPTIDRVIERVKLTPADHPENPIDLYVDGRPTTARASVTRDGSLIVFERGVSRAREIWRRNLKTGQQSLILTVDSDLPTNPTVSGDGSRIGYTSGQANNLSVTVGGDGFIVETDGGVPRKICERCGLYEFLSDNRRVVASIADKRFALIDSVSGQATTILTDQESAALERASVSPDDRWLAFRRTVGTRAKTYVMRVTEGAKAPAGKEVDEPTTTGRPCGWSADSTILYLLLDTDGSRCLWGQRINPATGELVGKPYIVRHLHEMANSLGGVGTSLGNAIAADGFFFETMSVKSSLWKLQLPR